MLFFLATLPMFFGFIFIFTGSFMFIVSENPPNSLVMFAVIVIPPPCSAHVAIGSQNVDGDAARVDAKEAAGPFALL